MKRRIIALLTALCLCGAVTGCGKTAGGESFGFTLAAEPLQIDPQVAQDTASLSVIAAVFEGLVRRDEDGAIVQGAATYDISADGKTYTFHLKENWWSTVRVKGVTTGFEDPVMVTAQDYAFGICRTADPATGSPYANDLAGIENAAAVSAGQMPVSKLGVRALDDTTVQISLSAPDAAFLEKLTTPGFMPCNAEFFNYTGGRYGLEKQYILTNGAFSVAAWEHKTSITLKKQDLYYDAANILPASVKYRIGDDETAAFALLQKGYIDGAMVPHDQTDTAEQDGISLVALPDTVRYLFFNTTDPTVGNADVRHALRDAIEWDALRGDMGAGYVPADGYVAPAATVGGQAYAGTFLPKTDTAAARAALQNALAALDRKKLPTLSILAAEDTDSANLARYIAQSFAKNLSVACELILVDAETLDARMRAGNYQLAIYNVTGRGLTALENLQMFQSTGIGNYARFSSTAFDTLYAAARDDAASVRRLEETLYTVCPALPLAYYTRYYGIRAEDVGIRVRPFNGGVCGALLSFRTADRQKS